MLVSHGRTIAQWYATRLKRDVEHRDFADKLSEAISYSVGEDIVKSLTIYPRKLKKKTVLYVEIRYKDPDTDQTKRYHKSTEESTLTAARAKARQIVADFKQVYEKQEGKGKTIGEFAQEYVEKVRNDCSHGHFKDARQFCNGLVQGVGAGTPLSRIDKKHIIRFIEKQSSQYRKNAARRILHTFFERAVKFEYVLRNVVSLTDKVKLKQPHPENILVPDFVKIVESLPTDTYRARTYSSMIAFAFQTGLRLGEAAYVQEQDIIRTVVDGKPCFTLVVANRTEHSTKSGKSRTIPLSECALELIWAQRVNKQGLELSEFRESKYLFPMHGTGSGTCYPRSVSEHLKKFAKLIFPQRRITFKATGNSFGYNLMNVGFSGVYTCKLMGHSSPAVTEKHYANVLFLDLPRAHVEDTLNSALAMPKRPEQQIIEKADTRSELEELLRAEGIASPQSTVARV